MNKHRILVRYNKMKSGSEFTQVYFEKFQRKQWDCVTATGFLTQDYDTRKKLVDIAVKCLKNSSDALLNMKHENCHIALLAQERLKSGLDSVIQCEVIEIKDKK